MIFPFEVKKNGIYYPAGTEVPTGFKGAEKPPKEPGKVETEKEPIKDVPVKEEPVKARKYTDDELNLPYMKLKSLATKEGFKVEKTAKADDIKEMLRSL